jgi:hypothetical protein
LIRYLQSRPFAEFIEVTVLVSLLFAGSVHFVSSSGREDTKLRVALVENSFTGAAYRYQGFYDFYEKHHSELDSGNKVTKDLNLLTAKIPKYSLQYQPSLLEDLSNHLKQLLPDADISIISDVDVHEGTIFNNSTSTSGNYYDVLILGHQEYVTQNEYDNLKQFVANGGTLVITTGNVFYAEVKYDKSIQSVTLVKGHDIRFDGSVAHKGIAERWKNETKHWLGSNFYPIYYGDKAYHHLNNNPFNFTGEGGGEEQYYDKSNPNIRIILDYNSSDPRYPIATYELNYGKGKSIVFGLAAEDILSIRCHEMCQKFFNFIDELILDHVLPFNGQKK